MQGLDPASILTICAVFGVIGWFVNWSVSSKIDPVKEDIAEMKKDIAILRDHIVSK